MANDKQTWDVIATPADRWYLSILLLNDGLTFKTRKEQKQLHQARVALDLYPPHERFTDGRQGRVPLAEDRAARRRFSVTTATLEFFTECLNKIEKGLNSAILAAIEPVMQQLEDQAHAEACCAEHPDAPAGKVVEDWDRSTAPLLDQPHRLVDEMAAVFRACKAEGYDIKILVDRFLEEAAPPKVEGKGGRLTAEKLNAGASA